jgi:Flp pilus assembly pilin Flp
MDFLELSISESARERRVWLYEAGVTIPEPLGTFMTWLTKAVKGFHRDEGAVELVEYGLLFVLITIVCLAGITVVGSSISGLYNAASTSI